MYLGEARCTQENYTWAHTWFPPTSQLRELEHVVMAFAFGRRISYPES